MKVGRSAILRPQQGCETVNQAGVEVAQGLAAGGEEQGIASGAQRKKAHRKGLPAACLHPQLGADHLRLGPRQMAQQGEVGGYARPASGPRRAPERIERPLGSPVQPKG